MAYRRGRALAVGGAVLALAGSSLAGGIDGDATAVEYEVVALTGLPRLGFRTAALNERGEVAGVLFATANEPARAFLWSDGEVRSREVGGAPSVLGLNEGGVVVGAASAPSACTLFAWFGRTGELRTVPTPVGAFPSDVNGDLVAVGGDCDGLSGFAVDLASETFQPIGFAPPPPASVGTPGALAINESGVAVGSEVVFDAARGFWVETPYRWTASSGIAPLPTLPAGFGGRAVDVSRTGSAGGYVLDAFAGKQTALWTDGGRRVVNLGSPFGYFVSEATAINAREELAVVAPNDLFGFTRAFLWDGRAFVDLSAFTLPSLGLFALRPVDLNDAGEVLVELGDAQGRQVLDTVVLRPLRRPPPARGAPSAPRPTTRGG